MPSSPARPPSIWTAPTVRRIVRGDSGLAQIELWTTVAGSAQIITGGVATIPRYPPLAAGGPGRYSNEKSWYDVPTARTIAGLDRQGKTLILATVDNAAGSHGLAVATVRSKDGGTMQEPKNFFLRILFRRG